MVNNGGAFRFPDDWESVGRILIPEHYDGGYVQRVDLKTGEVKVLYDNCDGLPLNSPNDIVFDSAGGFWFTCFGYSDGENRRLGGLYYAKADGSMIKRVRSEQISPNGVGLSPDQKTVYWSDSMLQKLWALDLDGPGLAGAETGHFVGRLVVTLPGMEWFDSMAVEADGGSASAPCSTAASPSSTRRPGRTSRSPSPIPSPPTSPSAAPDMRDAWVTCSSTGKLYRCRWPRPGLKLAFGA